MDGDRTVVDSEHVSVQLYGPVEGPQPGFQGMGLSPSVEPPSQSFADRGVSQWLSTFYMFDRGLTTALRGLRHSLYFTDEEKSLLGPRICIRRNL